jgi:hypothetical protein
LTAPRPRNTPPTLRRRISELDIPLWARNRAALYLANDDRLSAALRYQLAQVVYGYIGSCDEDAARKGMECEQDRDLGRTPTFSRRRSGNAPPDPAA